MDWTEPFPLFSVGQVEVVRSQVTTSVTEVKSSQTEVTDLKRTFQNLEIELQGLLTQVQYQETLTVSIW